MRTVFIRLPTVETVHAFVVRISSLDGQFDLLSERYILDAKSLMGILSLDLTKPLMLRVEKDTKDTMEAIRSFIVKDMAVKDTVVKDTAVRKRS